MINRLLQMEFAGVARAAFLIGGFSFVSRLIGLTRNSIFASKFGANEILDIYYAAFLIPDFIYQLFVLGLLSAVFIPIFSHHLHKNKEEAWHFTNTTLNLLLLIIGFFVVILFFAMPYILPLLVAGFSEHMKLEAVAMSRIMLVSPVFLALSSVFGSIVQNFKRYVYYSLAPIFYNIGIIVGAIVFEPWFGIYGLAVGVILGAFLHFSIQFLGAISAGFKYRPIFDLWHKDILKMGKLSIARFLSIAASQLNFMALISIASFLTVGSITVFNFANDLQYVPIGIVALSYAVAIFPKLSGAVAKGEKEVFAFEFSETFRQVLALVLPLSILIFLLRDQLVKLLFVGAVSGDTLLTAAALGIFSLSIFAQSLAPILSRAFFALQNTVIPFAANFISILVTISLSFVFMKLLDSRGALYGLFSDMFNLKDVADFSVLALPLAFSFGAIVNFLIMMFFLNKEVEGLESEDLAMEGGKMLISSLVMGIVIYLLGGFKWLPWGGVFFKIISQIVLLTIFGFGIYLLMLKILNAKEFLFFKKIIKRIIKRWRLAKEEIPGQMDNQL